MKLALDSTDESGHGPSPYPFRVVADSNPFSRVVEIQLMTDGRSVIKSLFLLMQKDKYVVGRTTLRPITNRDVEEAWQAALSHLAQGAHDEHPALFTGDADSRAQGPVLFEPLFFCKNRTVFFHPICPHCGTILNLCTDDALLTARQLPAYSTSLERTLFCPSCASSGADSSFYAYEVDETAYRPNLKDRWGLMEDYGRTLLGGTAPVKLPCMGCSQIEQCYGMNREFRSRISFFSFYPFYGLVSEALTMSALDYLALVSGASASELESTLRPIQSGGRARFLQALDDKERKGLFFDAETGDRRFLEVLHLKLCFLEELFGILRPHFQRPLESESLKMLGLSTSLNDVWVGLWDAAKPVPLLWNHQVRLIDGIGSFSGVSGVPGASASFRLLSLGVIWFCALIMNKRQGIPAIHMLLDELLGKSSGSESLFQGDDDQAMPPAFAAENIFWNPSIAAMGPATLHAWKKALNLGWSLVSSGYQYGRGWSEEAFLRELLGLRSEVKEMLFRTEGPPRLEEEVPSSDEEIYDILAELRVKWQSLIPKEKSRAPGVFVEDTLIFSPAEEEPPLPKPETRPGEDLLPETLVLEGESEEVEETILITAEEQEQEPPPVEPTREKDELPETIILGGIPTARSDERPEGMERKETRTAPLEDDLEETIILSSSEFERKISGPRGSAEEEEIPETLPVRPHEERTTGYRQPEQDLESEKLPVTEGRWPVTPATPDEAPEEVSDEEEVLEETIVLGPKRTTDKDKGHKKDS